MADWINRFGLTGKTAFVTGASSGIGMCICEVFADAGAAIVATGRSIEALTALQTRIVEQGGDCAVFTADLTTAEGARSAADQALKAAPQIDILVNSAGVALTGPLPDITASDWDTTMAVNLNAPFWIAQALAPGMIDRGHGKIINISSQTGVVALQDHAAYTASKGGLNAMTKALMVELAPHNIQVNAICPTVVMTQMGRELWSAPERQDPFLARTPLGRFGEPVEIADLALYLASPASNLVNGAIMMIEGGYSSI
ncbi:glucose 1-dehydrogenase [Rhodophyticola sp. CCM32]|uniref:SDR family NAD(P)-dependent oxidoreductase n=1 Tax=Rhodophyticola sp. CCM32 TaxID=2916397 RepID=UPI00107F9291|nr:glucose 1-dehydrogenase [Rhodophyticola sp. CCM32]QBX99938.1 glucose 1-dehydrogenase [Rhodophyticola sp. CCM32]